MNPSVRSIYNYFLEAGYGTVQEAQAIFKLPEVEIYIESKYRYTYISTIAENIKNHKNEYLALAKVVSVDLEKEIQIIKANMPMLAEFNVDLFEAINKVIESKEVPKIENPKKEKKINWQLVLSIIVISSFILERIF